MWIKRAKEYEKNINSGDPVLIAEVVRDLHKKMILLNNNLIQKDKFT